MLASMLDNTNLVKRNFHWKQSLFIKATKLLPSNMVGWNSCCTKSLHSIVIDESTVPERWKAFLNTFIRAQNIPKIKALTETWSRLIRPLSLSLKEKEDLFYWHAELQISYIWQTILIVKSSQQRSDCWTSVLDENSVGVEGPEGGVGQFEEKCWHGPACVRSSQALLYISLCALSQRFSTIWHE